MKIVGEAEQGQSMTQDLFYIIPNFESAENISF